ncbi:MAG: WD40 repeat domain-containing protein [Bacteroidota bacterium]
MKTIQAGDEIMQVAFSRDSRFFSAQFQRKDLVKVWKTETLQFQSEIDSNRGFSGVLWTPGRELIVGGNGGSVFRSSVSVNDTKEEIFKLPSGFGAKWFTLSPDGSKLMLQSASKPWPIFVQNLSDNTFIQFNPPTLSSNAGIFHPDGETLVLFGTNLQPRSSGGDRQDGLVELWSISGSGVTFSRRIILKEEVTSVAD